MSALTLLIGRLTKKEIPAVLSSSMGIEATDAKHVMVSYSWSPKARPELVVQLTKSLSDLGYEVWRDVNGSALVPPMSGSTDDRMAEAIECSHTVIVCVSKEYKVSGNCRSEANYANQLRKKGKVNILYVMMQEGYTTVSEPDSVDGYLGLMIGASLWYPLWNAEHAKTVATDLAGIIGDNAKAVKGYVRALKTAVRMSSSTSEPIIASLPAPNDEISKRSIFTSHTILSS
jgi:hypothetical protein